MSEADETASRIPQENIYEVFVLNEGFSHLSENGLSANCTCTLIKGNKNLIVDTMTPWDSDLILKSLSHHGLEPKDINFVISTHGHSDHCGNNNLFLNAIHIMGYSISYKSHYFNHSFDTGVSYKIDDFIEIIPTPGHMLAHVSVLVRTADGKNVVVAGDLFENEHDISNDEIWRKAGTENEKLQIESRKKVLQIADKIVPGHGKMFNVK